MRHRETGVMCTPRSGWAREIGRIFFFGGGVDGWFLSFWGGWDANTMDILHDRVGGGEG